MDAGDWGMLPPMPSQRRLRILAVALALQAAIAPPRVAHADETNATNVAAARKHFEKARAFYAQGAYRDAITELEAAHALDPNAKDLVFNLGVVHEKLGDIEDALKWFKQYTMMDLTAQERERADAYIKRLEGAKKELEEKQNAAPAPPQEATPPGTEGGPPAPRPAWPPSPGSGLARGYYAPPPPSFGRVDALTLTAAGLSVIGLGFGVALGIKALADRPPSTPTTSASLTFAQLMKEVDQAHNEGILADVSFAVALVAGAATAYLYFGRTRSVPAVSTGSTTVSAAPVPGGGALLMKGSF
jgi:tetratricopeptide (TPR) repeat protein